MWMIFVETLRGDVIRAVTWSGNIIEGMKNIKNNMSRTDRLRYHVWAEPINASIAQQDRASDFESAGWEFKSL